MNKFDTTKFFSNYFCKVQKPGLHIIKAGQKNALRRCFTKSNDEVLTTCFTCTYLLLRLKLFLNI